MLKDVVKRPLLPIEIFIDGGGCALAVTHGQNDGCPAPHDITTGEYSGNAGLSFIIDHYIAPLVEGQVRCGSRKQRVGAGAHGVDDDSGRQFKIGTFNDLGSAPSRIIRRPKLHVLGTFSALTQPSSVPIMAVGAVSMMNSTPSSLACLISSTLAGISVSPRR